MSRADLVQEVNARVNAYPYRTDVDAYGMSDFWERISVAKVGDCEDFALEKRAQLQQAGVPLSDMRLALCWTGANEYHAILIVADPAAGGDWILDNRQPAPFTLDDFRGLGYRGHMLQVPGAHTWEIWST